MGIELYIVKIKNIDGNLFDNTNCQTLDMIFMKTIITENPEISYILSESNSIERNDTYLYDSSVFKVVSDKILDYCSKMKVELDRERNEYMNNKVLKYLKENPYEKIEEKLKNREYSEYKSILKNLIEIIEEDFSDNYDKYEEWDSYEHELNMRDRIKFIGDKLSIPRRTFDILFFILLNYIIYVLIKSHFIFELLNPYTLILDVGSILIFFNFFISKLYLGKQNII